ncbi:hypothetical protein J4421_04500 [Candidatus Woesearchaeota archaeon]|nr:hypothetical protein [Candidatus Woesearchaeota archaeon]
MIKLNKTEDNLKKIIDTLNKRGFILEDKTYKILSESCIINEIEKSKPLINPVDGSGTEIDLFIKTENKILVVECKRTDYSWFFPKNTGKMDRINFIIDTNNGIRTNSRETNDFKVVYSDLALKLDETGKVSLKSDKITVETSYKDVNDHIYQIIRGIQIYLRGLKTPDDRFLNKSLIPIIVTNASLFIIEYSYEELDANGDMKNHQKINEVPYLAYNYPQILGWDRSQIVGHVGTRNIEDSEHLKTVFVVNIERLKDFINVLLLQDN